MKVKFWGLVTGKELRPRWFEHHKTLSQVTLSLINAEFEEYIFFNPSIHYILPASFRGAGGYWRPYPAVIF